MLNEHAHIAELNSRRTNTVIQDFAPNPAPGVHFGKIKRITKKQSQPVYDMTVEDTHNFAVNGGLIVSNCIDATRYALYPVWRLQGE